ncbi:hydroxymethylbilane synthase [Pseudahrensia aquimaris]|uniref:Porphobilinogen deaminase n=1 Tax=Pseudahrensia aquimaris TaxID=744461 RepID=A0ABW3FGH4_9HYPH
MTKIRIGTRGSALAMAQAHEVRARLSSVHGMDEEAFEIKVISVLGDRVQDRPLSEVGGKGLFSKEIELALSDGEIDLAVHSTKDMASVLPDGLEITCYLPREDVRDAFLSPVAKRVQDLPQGAVVGSSSLRRQALLKRMRPDLEIVMFRGNVQTRMAKLEAGDVAATLLANAGLRRLGMDHAITSLMEVDKFLPAPGQGAICIESREDDVATRELVAAINDGDTELALTAERAFLRALDGSCRTPIAGLAQIGTDAISFKGMILSEDGQTAYDAADTCSLSVDAARAMGEKAGTALRQQAGDDFFQHWT